MAAIKLTDFADLVRAIRNELKIQSSDTESINRIKQTLNFLYVDEVVPYKRWWWLQGSVDIQTIPFFADGTCSVTPSIATITLSVPPPLANGSLAGYYFSTTQYDEVYTIQSHTAGSGTIVLSQPYTGAMNTVAQFKIWTDKLALPVDMKETQEVRHDHSRIVMSGLGFKEFRRLLTGSPKAEGNPSYFNVLDFYDPTPLTGETADERYRRIQIYPAIFNSAVTIHVDYIKETPWLDADTDEPAMPIEDRIVLYYGALSQLWTSLMRNPEEAARNYALYQAKLARMAGKIEEGFDKPIITPDAFYFRAKRGRRINSSYNRNFDSLSSGSGANIPTYAKNITLEGGTFTANFTASPGVTIDGRDISVDGAALDAHIAASMDVHGIGPGNSVVGDATIQTLTNKTITTLNNSITDVTPDSVATFDALGALTGSTLVDTTELGYLNDNEPLSAVTLADNQVATADVVVFPATWTSIQLMYSILRGASNIEDGMITLSNDGTTANVSTIASGLGSSGISFTADVNAGNVRLRYTSTSTGTPAIFQYKTQKWVA